MRGLIRPNMGAEMADASRIDLPSFCAQLAHRYSNPPTYPRLWQKVIAGDLPAERIGNRWVMLEGAEPAAVATFRLRPKEAPGPIAA
jgi:hypothetical protein